MYYIYWKSFNDKTYLNVSAAIGMIVSRKEQLNLNIRFDMTVYDGIHDMSSNIANADSCSLGCFLREKMVVMLFKRISNLIFACVTLGGPEKKKS